LSHNFSFNSGARQRRYGGYPERGFPGLNPIANRNTRVDERNVKTRENTDRPAPVSRILSRIGLTIMVGFFLNSAEGFAADELPTLHAWVRHDSGQAPNLFSIARFNGRWIAGGQDGAVLTSDDGYSWSESQVGLPGDAFEIHQTESAVYLKNSGYCEEANCHKNIYRSEDGISWSLIGDLPATLAPVANLPAPYRPSAPPFRAGDRWLVQAHVSSVNAGAVFASENGTEWTRVLINSTEFDSLAGRNGFTLASDIEGQIHFSTDLENWTSVRLPDQAWATSVLVGDGFVLAGAKSLSGLAGGIYASVDGTEWERMSVTDEPIYGGAEIDGSFWFLGQYGLIVEVDFRKPAPLVNLSVRATSEDSDSAHIAGFVVEGEGPRQMLIRAIGPGLEAFGVDDAMAAPRLEVWSGQALVDAGRAWVDEVNADAIEAAAEKAGAFALDSEAGDAALLLSLLPGAYTALAYGQSDGAGQGLIEVYDVTESGSHASALTNSSDRGFISADNPMVGGFVLSGDRDRFVLIRAVGPGLDAYDVADTATDPSIAIWQNGEVIAENNDWDESEAALVVDASREAGAFELATGSKDAALVFQASPGAYTVHVTASEGSDGGEALLEIYYLDL
jgi:hypothetical protein